MSLRTASLWIVFAAPLAAQQPVSKAVNFYSPEREIRIGREAAYNLEHTLPIVRVAKLEQYIAKLGGLLGQGFVLTIYDDRKPFTAYPGELAMPADAFGSSEPVALPGGFIFVPMSLLADAHSEPEIAFQLAHAMAHITRRHGSRRATREEMAGMATADISIHTAAVNVDFSTGQMLAGRLGGLQFARTCELEADRTAAGMLAGAGFDPNPVLQYLESLASGKGTPAFSAHPPVEKRIAAFEEGLALTPPSGRSTATGDFAAMKSLAATIR